MAYSQAQREVIRKRLLTDMRRCRPWQIASGKPHRKKKTDKNFSFAVSAEAK